MPVSYTHRDVYKRQKYDFLRTIIRDGALPRKTFSMGEADEKRFDLECRQIVP